MTTLTRALLICTASVGLIGGSSLVPSAELALVVWCLGVAVLAVGGLALARLGLQGGTR